MVLEEFLRRVIPHFSLLRYESVRVWMGCSNNPMKFTQVRRRTWGFDFWEDSESIVTWRALILTYPRWTLNDWMNSFFGMVYVTISFEGVICCFKYEFLSQSFNHNVRPHSHTLRPSTSTRFLLLLKSKWPHPLFWFHIITNLFFIHFHVLCGVIFKNMIEGFVPKIDGLTL